MNSASKHYVKGSNRLHASSFSSPYSGRNGLLTWLGHQNNFCVNVEYRVKIKFTLE
jgi:hypothetical protein